ncbi:TonB-dependent receptor [Steroidobacter agaridevorans]|uniref:TonB-dependent receptor n=1 Tax=Steroidobacter agaridevorans TaxID=2695856 RepID=A0A829YBV0_9GAMM|nr:TonB-dependent receptor [Steroidobacter agaridevorans]GFE80082.1 TonB-dependent receptor [Steroidobacter agaridevorans]
MRSFTRRTGNFVAAAIVSALGFAATAHAQSQSFDVPAQSAASGVREFAQQAGIQVIVAGTAAHGRTTNKVQGNLDTRSALERLLSGTGLVVRSFDGTVAILDVTADASPDSLEQVLVTGSRIARPDLENPMPVRVLRMDEAERFGHTDLYGALAEVPGIGVGNSLLSSSTSWDSGATFINLRNLGTNRSLTLIDGKRRVSSSARSSAVDIGTIPLGMIERVEIVTGGAAAVYGADAVTGAVNIITKKEINETTLSVKQGVSDRNDADEFQASVSTGFNFGGDRGRVAVGGTYTKTDPLYMYERYDWHYQPFVLANPANRGTSDGVYDNVNLFNYRQHYYAYEPNFWLADEQKRYMLEEGGTVRPMVHDVLYSNGPAQFATGNGGDGRNLTDMSQYRGGEEAITVLGRTEFDITDKLRWAGYFNFAKTDYDGAASYWRDDTRATFFGGAGSAKAYLDNPYLPDSIRAIMEAKGLTSLNIDRTYGNFPVREEDHRRRTSTVGMELSGEIAADINWSAFAQYGRVKDHAIQGNVPWKSHWLAARDVITGPNGTPVCRSEAARAEGCVPLNIFSQIPASEALKNYVMSDRDEYRTTTQQLFGAEIHGSAFQLPAGKIGYAFGVEYRKDTLKNEDDPMALSGELVYGGGPGARSELDVSASVKEVFTEVLVPVLADAPFARRVNLELAYRYSDYNTVGGTNAWKAGLIWEPLQGFSMRGVQSRSVRTPNFGELYEPVFTNTTLGSITDPCMVASYYATAERAANCAALGVPAPGIVDPKVGPHVTTGGNPELGPETSDSLTIGFVWQPSFLPNFDLTVDYWDIDIEDVIYQLSYIQVLNLCVDMPSIDNQYCAAQGRNLTPNVPTSQHGILMPAGAALWVKAQQANISRLYANGVDVSLSYRIDVGPGRLGFRLAGTRLIEDVLETTPGVAAGDQRRDGAYTNPKTRATLTTTYDVGNFGMALSSRYWGKGLGNVLAMSGEQYQDNTVPSVTYHDLSARYTFGGHTVNFAVNNLFDKFPPQMGFGEPGIYFGGQVYDLVGRNYNVGWTYRF